jgi:hypothetical protein
MAIKADEAVKVVYQQGFKTVTTKVLVADRVEYELRAPTRFMLIVPT